MFFLWKIFFKGDRAMYEKEIKNLFKNMNIVEEGEKAYTDKKNSLAKLEGFNGSSILNSDIFKKESSKVYYRLNLFTVLVSIVISLFVTYTYLIDIPFIKIEGQESNIWLYIIPISVYLLIIASYIFFVISESENTKLHYKNTVFNKIIYLLSMSVVSVLVIFGLLLVLFVGSYVYDLFAGSDVASSNFLDICFYIFSLIPMIILVSAIVIFILSLVLLPIVFFRWKCKKTIRDEKKQKIKKITNEKQNLSNQLKLDLQYLEMKKTDIENANFIHKKYKTQSIVRSIVFYLEEYPNKYDYFSALNKVIFNNLKETFNDQVDRIKSLYQSSVSKYKDDLAFIDARWKVRDKSFEELNVRQKGQFLDSVDKFNKL